MKQLYKVLATFTMAILFSTLSSAQTIDPLPSWNEGKTKASIINFVKDVTTEKYAGVVPQVFDLWQDPQERYDIFMTNWTENTWVTAIGTAKMQEIIATYQKYPPRKMQSEIFDMPLIIVEFRKMKGLKD